MVGRVTGAAVIAVLLASCASAPTSPSVPLSDQFTLSPGGSAQVQGTPLTVRFLEITGDSRCPGDAICIQGGDAVVHVEARATTTADYELHTGDSSRASATHAGFVIMLKDVQPYPFSSRPPIKPGDYRVTLVVTR